MTKKRVHYPNRYYHVTNRGLGRQTIYFDLEDKMKFMEVLAKAKTLFNYELITYCLMPTHYHLQIRSSIVPLAQVMKYVNQRYTRYFNKKYQRNGRAFGGRYKSKLIVDKTHFIKVANYIHLNPIPESLCDELKEYAFCSFRNYLLGCFNESLIDEEALLRFFQNSSQRYAEHCEVYKNVPKAEEVAY